MENQVKDFFGLTDYIVFILTLAVSAVIGIYYGFVNRNRSDTKEFLMGGRSLNVFPVAMSVLASFMSAITLLGAPAEAYRFGTQYMIINIAFCFVVPSTAYLYLPVFYRLGITSAYEYLELRFHRFIRTIGTIVFWLHMMMYMPVVLYAPALALAEVTGLSMWFSVLSVGLVCTFYTSIGGMRAVVLTDLFQTIVMYVAILAIVIKGTYDLGGIDVVWERSINGGRIDFFNFSFDPTVRHTFWSLAIGGYITWMGNYAANQAMVQRYLTIGTLKGAQRCLWINLPALVLLITITTLAGLVIYAFYYTCDPIGTKIIYAPDQLFPRFVMETLGNFPGIPGLFVSGIFSGALSTVSSGVNSLAAVTLEDIIKTYIVRNISELWATRVTKCLAVIYGLISIALVFVAQQLGGVLQAALTIHGIVGGPMLALFTLGMFFPWSNTIGAAVGVLSGFIMAMWLGMGAFIQQPFNPEAPRSYENCTELYQNITGTKITGLVYVTPRPNEFSGSKTTVVMLRRDLQFSEESEPLKAWGTKPRTTVSSVIFYEISDDLVFPPYRLSYMWVSSIGFVVTILVGNIISLLTGPSKIENVDRRLLSPIVLWLRQILPGKRRQKVKLNRTKDASMATLKDCSVISDDSFYPMKRISSNLSELKI